MKTRALSIAIAYTASMMPLMAATCVSDDRVLQGRIDTITKAYEKKFDARREQVEKDAQKIKDDAPKPNPVTGTLNFDIDVKWNEQEVKLHIPEFKLEDKKLSFDIPRMELKQQTWIYHTPSIRMESVCVNKPPETVCEMKTKCVGSGVARVCLDVPECYTRAGGQMCTDVPKPFMQEQKTILGVPEITGSEKKEIVVGMPAVEMRLQTWKIKVPEFTLKNISAEVSKTKERAAELQQREKNAAESLSSAMQGEIKQVSADSIASMFDCQASELRSQKDKAINDIDANINTIKASIDSASKYGAAAMQESMQKALIGLIDAREKAIASFADAENKLIALRKEQIEKVLQ